ncbi:fimbrial protein [Serratia ficaria]|uniref:fimbrial protein n=1 Tax=Serratia ficaria TaxID=61651 RepID=UPI0021BA7F5C|nr:fimbrial protein [Serratia ficaria]
MNVKAMLGVVGLCACTVAFAGNRHFVITEGGKVHIRGSIADAACSVSAGSENQVVDMGQFRSNQFDALGSYASPIPFVIALTDCHASMGERVAIAFKGVSDGKDPLVFQAGAGADTPPGVGLAIFDGGGNIIPPNALPRTMASLHRGEMLLHFTARYRATSRQVSGGNADAWTWFTLTYQ